MHSYRYMNMTLIFALYVLGAVGGCGENKADEDTHVEITDSKTSLSDKCRFSEKYDDKRKLCWDRCVIGERWTGEDCNAVNYHKSPIDYDSAVASCKSLGARLPTVDEFESLLGKCYDSGSMFELRQCNSCRKSEECMNILGRWFIHEGFGLWASGREPRRVYLFYGRISPREDKYDPDEQGMWAVCVRDLNDETGRRK